MLANAMLECNLVITLVPSLAIWYLVSQLNQGCTALNAEDQCITFYTVKQKQHHKYLALYYIFVLHL